MTYNKIEDLYSWKIYAYGLEKLIFAVLKLFKKFGKCQIVVVVLWGFFCQVFDKFEM